MVMSQHNLQIHLGSSPVHIPIERQIRSLSPSSINPSLQVYTARENAVLLNCTMPLAGSVRTGHRIAARETSLSYGVYLRPGEFGVGIVLNCYKSMSKKLACLHVDET